MIHVIATIEIVPGKRNEFLAAFHQLMPSVHAEHGCVEYGPTVDAVAEMAAHPPRPDVVVVVEKWESLPALKAHLSASHMAEFRRSNGRLIHAIAIQVLEPA